MSTFLKMGAHLVAKMNGTQKIHIDLAAPIFWRRFFERLSDCKPRIVHQNVEISEVCNDALNHVAHRSMIRDIGLIGICLSTFGTDLGHDGLGVIGRMIMVDCDGRTFRGER